MPLKRTLMLLAGGLLLAVTLSVLWDAWLAGQWGRLIYEVTLAQRGFHRELIDALKAMQQDEILYGFTALGSLSFFYGIFHAAGPGHGKAVLSAWLVSHPSLLRRALAIAVIAALAQGVTAIVLIYGLFAVLGLLGFLSSDLIPLTERASYILVMLVGVWLVWRAIGLWRQPVASPEPTHHHNHNHDHGHHHHQECDAPGHVHGPDCGHPHLPGPGDIAGTSDWRSVGGMILAIGLRPCSGALIVLTLAKSLGWDLAGIAAVLAMSLGTAITTGALAALAVFFRQLAARLLHNESRFLAGKGEALLRLVGGVLIGLLGLVLLQGSLQSSHPLGL